MLRALIGFLCVCCSTTAQAKLGESVPQLVKRFGKSYTVESVRGAQRYKFRSANVSVDAIIANGVAVAETYFSDHPLTASGDPPNEIVQAVLKTNAPGIRWIETDATPFGANYALQSFDHKYTAFLRYKGPQPENAVWTMTVARGDNWVYAATVGDILGSPPATASKGRGADLQGESATSTAVPAFDPSKPFQVAKVPESKSGMPALPWETPSSKVLTVFINHISDVEALYKRPLSHTDGEWVYAVDRVACSAADYAIEVDLLSRLHWQPEDKVAINAFLAYVQQMLTSDIRSLDGAVNNGQLAVIREEARSLRNDIRTFNEFVASMSATVSALPAATPPQHADSEQRRDSF
jgi:hypothetical protein